MAPTFVQVFLGLAAVLSAASAVSAETHTISFDNQCGKGTPQLLVGGKVVSTGEPYTFNGIISSAIAYLQTGPCGFNGEGCTLLEMTLVNPTAPGSGSSTDISLITPHALNVPASFSYYGGCNGQGASCDSGSCTSAFHVFNDNQVQVQCETNNANLLISFCADAATNELVVGGSGGNTPAAPSSSTSYSSSHSSSHSASAAPASSPAPAKAPAKATPTPAAASTSAAASAAPSVDRGSCKNKKRMMRRRATAPELEARALHDVHARSH
ncbi:hypothetical protein PsYK624_111260 [Phanerochaete sordida]|uniref:Glycopeptide n=1 Tax=Phanerochaete sordida TaxID=48140 RepID=A0A9P3GJY6_9APHY|nr:hypothetical protein PsYK624_111260 [Phanerochaete sordida]